MNLTRGKQQIGWIQSDYKQMNTKINKVNLSKLPGRNIVAHAIKVISCHGEGKKKRQPPYSDKMVLPCWLASNPLHEAVSSLVPYQQGMVQYDNKAFHK